MKTLQLKKGDLDFIYPYLIETFPSHELKPYEAIKPLIEDGQYDILLAYDQVFIGYALVFCAEKNQILWLDFIAILPPFQSFGYGSLLFQRVIEYYGPNYKGMVFEVEIPNGSDPNQQRRIDYYKRLHAKILPIDYALPTYEGPFPMYLMGVGKDLTCIHETITEALTYIHRDLLTKGDPSYDF